MSTIDEEPDEAEYGEGETLGRYWSTQIEHSGRVFDEWEKRSKRVVERYRDERDLLTTLVSKFNILWSNIQVLTPSLYGRSAKPEVARRYQDSDPIGRLASMMLERTLSYEIEQFPDFNAAMESSVEDRLLPGRGTCWLRFEPVITDENGVQVTSSEDGDDQIIDRAHSPVDYVYWKDFRHSPARTWDEVWWCARRVYMTKDEGIERFGEDKFEGVPLVEYKEDNSNKSKDQSDKATFGLKAAIWEIWNKRTAKVCWIAEDHSVSLDEKDDPLELEGFFPCPKPLYATTTNGSLVPVPDYCEYQDQAEELDSLTSRITALTEAVRATGVFDGSFKELARLLSTKGNKLIPVTNWQKLSEKNGLKGAVDMLDISPIVQAISVLSAQREIVKQTIYEICGISDILRGATKAEETLGAQQLKANFGSMRLKRSQTDVARYASDIFKLKAQIICRFYPPELIVQMSDIFSTDEAKTDPEFEQNLLGALHLLSESTMRDFHIAVESDSLAQIDDEAEKAAANEAITAIATFLKEALPAIQAAPQMLPMFSEMLLFLVRRYRAGRTLESAIETAMKQLADAAAQPKGPTPEQQEMQMQQQADQMRIQADTQAAQMKEQFAAQAQTQKLQAEGQLESIKAQMNQAMAKYEADLQAQSDARKYQFELEKTRIERASAERIALQNNQTQLLLADAKKEAELDKIAAEAQAASDEQARQIEADMQEQLRTQAEERSARAADQAHEQEMAAEEAKTREVEAVASAPAQEEPKEEGSSMPVSIAISAPAAKAKSKEESMAAIKIALANRSARPKPQKSAPVPANKRKIIYGEDGLASGVQIGDKQFKAVRDEHGRIVELSPA